MSIFKEEMWNKEIKKKNMEKANDNPELFHIFIRNQLGVKQQIPKLNDCHEWLLM